MAKCFAAWVSAALLSAEVEATGSCSAADQTYIHSHKGNGADSWGKMSSDCGHEAFSIFHGFDESKFKTCLVGKTQVSNSCAGCYAQAGKYGVGNCKLACISSWCSESCLKCSEKNKVTLDSCTGFPEDAVAPCDHELSNAMEVAGSCSAADQTYIHAHKGNGADSWGKMSSDCGHKAFSIFHGFDESKFKTCLVGKTQVSNTCAGCYAEAGKYGVANCKLACISSWCSESCLKCSEKNKATLDSCTGFPEDSVAPCSSEHSNAMEVAGSCSAADQTYIHAHKGNRADSWGKMSSDCGHEAFSIFHGFDESKFKTCLVGKTQVSNSCAGCYAEAGKYGVDNCKLACISSWCSESCLKCSEKNKASLDSCTGFPEDSVAPCDSENKVIV